MGFYVQHGIFFLENFAVHFNTNKAETFVPRTCFFFNFPPFLLQKHEFWGLSPGLNCVKIDPELGGSKKNNYDTIYGVFR